MACNELDRGYSGLAGILLGNAGILANAGILLGSRASWPTRASSWVRGYLPGFAGIFLGLRASWPTRWHLPKFAGIFLGTVRKRIIWLLRINLRLV
ncbi:uncharacterized protein THITE_2116847 [Thermothielavioides terrestris NRRL 8126]|uniref:Uncharacterized protein n=1 Tax=Thermothielavioides terrestris (strain ATCC 38088 / NRRL 8126) TaxID=578455 RepID=G2R776_THETT|nr:uncharacterized protein THITE_2116847 [Thermothielavioides terrestris NRRL 8126]AEO67785.1 hypothetical protein THITE_2116847 [Thermothielavioides terrestris NRRL 8126]